MVLTIIHIKNIVLGLSFYVFLLKMRIFAILKNPNQYKYTKHTFLLQMSLIEKIMKVFFGDKSAKDIKAIRPYIDRALSYGESLKSISNDQLRAKTTEFRTRIKEAVEALEAEIATLQSQADVENQKAVGDTSGEGASNQDEKTRLIFT